MASNSRRFPTAQSPRRVAVKTAAPDVGMEREQEQFVTVMSIANRLGRTTSGVLYLARKLNIKPRIVRDEAYSKARLAVTVEEARRLIDGDIKSVTIVKPEDIFK